MPAEDIVMDSDALNLPGGAGARIAQKRGQVNIVGDPENTVSHCCKLLGVVVRTYLGG